MAGDRAELDAVDVLTQVGAARDAFCEALGDEPDTDAALVGDLLRVSGRVSAALAERDVLVALASILRTIDGWRAERISLEELATGLRAHAMRHDGFADFGSVRVDLRTLLELVEHRLDPRGEAARRAQVLMLDGELRAWFTERLLGTEQIEGAPSGVVDDARAPYRVTDPGTSVAHDDAVTELFAGSAHHVLRGLASSFWKRGWRAVPMSGEQLGEQPGEIDGLIRAAQAVGADTIVQIDLAVPARWRVRGRRVRVLDGRRASFAFPASVAGLAPATHPRRGLSLFTTPDIDWVFVERDEHHVFAAAPPVVDAFLAGGSVVEAMANFRAYVEAFAIEDEEPPEHLADAATAYGRLGRRSAEHR